jgi:hypothetical protein
MKADLSFLVDANITEDSFQIARLLAMCITTCGLIALHFYMNYVIYYSGRFNIEYFAPDKYFINWSIRKLLIDFERVYDAIVRVLYNILIEFQILSKLIRLNKICVHKVPVRFCIYKYSSDAFLVHSGLKMGMLYLHWILMFINIAFLHSTCFSTLVKPQQQNL